MKEKAELMSPPSERPRRKSTRVKQDDFIYLPEGEEDSTEPKKKKIKIRLKDPSKPHSYVCEIFDSSLENDESDGKLEDSDIVSESGDVKDESNGLGTPKPKNYFDILMSKESRRNFNVISSVENEKLPEESKSLRVVESEEVINERKNLKKRNEERLSEMVAAKKNSRRKGESPAKFESDSSDDESLFVVRSKLKKQNGLVDSTESKEVPIANGEVKENPVNNVENETTTNERPKRSNILNYFPKVENEPAKPKPKLKTKKKKLKEIDMFKNMKKPSWEIRLKSAGNSNDEDDPEPELSVNEDSNSSEVLEITETKENSKVPSTNNENVKIAPLFQKKLKKSISIDPEVQKARLEFLHSGIPTAVKKNVEIQKSQSVESDIVYFPTISHVQQKDENACWNLQNISIPRLKLASNDYVSHNSNQKFKFSIADDININNLENCKVELFDDALNRFQVEYKGMDVNSIFHSLREKFEKHKEKIQEIKNEKKINKDDSVEIIDENNGNFEYYNSVWTEKYKPKSLDILGNLPTVKKLEKWLQAWKAFDEEMKRLSKLGMKVKSKASTDSDDFITSDEDECSVRSPGNTCLLTGPIGSGKTALVYALANELEFNVLEVNASSKRTGKKLLTDLQEATQSHKVHHDVGSQPLANLFEKQKNKKKLKGKKTRKKKKAEVIEQANNNNNCKISLILIEDADVVFEEHDEGFVSAIMTLVQSSKRPVIFLTSDNYCNHLERIKTPHCIWLQMFRPNFVTSCAFLEMISILEGVFVKKSVIETILEQNQCDLRKSLLELQFWIQSGRSLISMPKPLTLGQLWWGLNKFLYNNDIRHKVKPKASKRKRINEYFDSSDEEDGVVKKLKTSNSTEITRTISDREIGNRDPGIHEYSKILNCLTLVDMINLNRDDEPIPDWEYKPSDSLSLLENMDSVNCSTVNLSNELVGELINLSTRIFTKNKKLSDGTDRKLNLICPSWEEISWRQQQEEARLELVSLVPACSGKEKRILNLDYLPVIRNMCRTEKHRFTSNTKRKNRFYHYLRTLGADPNDDMLDISCDVFKSQI